MFRKALTGAVALAAFAVAAFVGVAAVAPASAQTAVGLSRTATRVLFDGTDTVKDDDGGRVTLHTVLEYNPSAGEYVQTVTEADGRIRSRDVSRAMMVPPTRDEDLAAKALIALEPAVAADLSRSAYPTFVDGGFALVREAGHACGPGSRCLQYDVLQSVPGETFARRLRYVVVDLQSLTVVSNDFDPAAEGNLANPAFRAQSRSN